ncbi:VOC family protein [Faecalicatena contorta]|uniref:VOC family protein n=1 Tax=Faecalicatena contorta TaxID=39482 RepID=UPI001897F201
MEAKFGKVIHLGIVVEDVHKAVAIYEEEFGITPWEVSDHADFFADKIVNGTVGVDFASTIYKGNGYELELIAPNGPSVYHDWLKEHGPSLHHVKLETKENYDDVMAMAKRISGRDPYLEMKWQDGKPIVGYADMLKETGLLLEISKE